MRAIVGIGNPGAKYKLNRHNIGYLILDYFSQSYNLKFSNSKYDFHYLESQIGDNKFMLVKPTTYVNKTGEAVFQLVENFFIEPQNILVLVDDVNLKKFDFRLKKNGSDGGHNGLYSIISQLKTTNFPRLRIGIGNEFEKGKLSDFVLSDFSDNELKILENLFPFFAKIIQAFITGGFTLSLSVYSNIKQQIKKDNNN